MRQVATSSWRQGAWTLLRPVLPLVAAGVFLWKQRVKVSDQFVPWPHEIRSVDDATLFTLLLAVTAALITHGIVQLGEWIHRRTHTPAHFAQYVVLVATVILSGLSARSVHNWIALGEPPRSDPMFSDDGGSEWWDEYMDAYWLANTWRVAVIALILFNIGVWIAIRSRGAPEFNAHLLEHRASVAWAITGLAFIAALLLFPDHGWANWGHNYPRPWWQPKSQFPHLYLSSNWWPLTLVVLVAIHALTRLCLRSISRNAVRRPTTP